MVQTTPNPIANRAEEQQLLHRLATGETHAFWELFQPCRDYLFRCCLKWTNGNLTEAEDLLSQAMLKSFEKAQKYAETIENFKSWLTTLTRNFWLDITRRPCANKVEDIEVYAEREEVGRVSVGDTPESALEEEEKNRVIRAAIDELPTKMRETYHLHFYEDLSHQEIVERQGISYPNTCKRISEARKILREELRGYFIEEEKISTEVSVTPVAIEPVVEETPLENVGVEAIVEEPVLSVAVAEVDSVVVEESPEVAQSSFGITKKSPNDLRNVISFKYRHYFHLFHLFGKFALQVSYTPKIAVRIYFRNLITMKFNSHASIVLEDCDQPSDMEQIFWQRWQQYLNYLDCCSSIGLSKEEINSQKQGRNKFTKTRLKRLAIIELLKVTKMKKISHVITAIMAAIAIAVLTILPANAQENAVLQIPKNRVVTMTFTVQKCAAKEDKQQATLKFLNGTQKLEEYVVGNWPKNVTSKGANRIANDGPSDAVCQS